MATSLGTHRARAVEGDFGVSSKGNDQVGVSFEIVDGDYKNRRFGWYGFFNSPDNAKRAFKSLYVAGATGIYDDPTNLAGLGTADVEVELEEEEYEGKSRIKVAWVNEVGGGVRLGTRMDNTQRASFKARLQGQALACKPENAPKVAPRQAPLPARAPAPSAANGNASEHPIATADEIPF